MAYVAPQFKTSAFTCPHCNVFAHMNWRTLAIDNVFSPVWSALCDHCHENSIWLADNVNPFQVGSGKMLHPPALLAPSAHPDMPDAVKADYEEARAIANASPRGASALLRVCIEKLCTDLGAKGKTINDQVGYLVAQGMPLQIQKALDGVRVIGNNAVHPGKMEADDVADVSLSLFKLVNLIIENQITQPRLVDEVYGALPEGAKAGIKERDAK